MSANKKCTFMGIDEVDSVPRVFTNKKPSDYDYQRFIIRTPGLQPTTISLYWHEYSFLLSKVEGRKPRALSKLVKKVANKLRLDGYVGTLSNAVRLGVRAML